jgi:hypothetical protein
VPPCSAVVSLGRRATRELARSENKKINGLGQREWLNLRPQGRR